MNKPALLVLMAVLSLPAVSMCAEKILPADWDAKRAADSVMAGLGNVCAPEVKGAHDSDFTVVGERAYVVYMANDKQPGEAAGWPFIYDALSIVNLRTLAVEKVIRFAESEQAFENVTLPVGSCFVSRIFRMSDKTLRCFFASEQPGKRQAQTWYRDFDVASAAFEKGIHKAKIKTGEGVFDMQPAPFYRDAAAHGFTNKTSDHGLYLIDSFKQFDGRTYCVVNNYIVGQNALAAFDPPFDTFEILGQFNEPQSMKLTEAAVNRLPDGTWIAVCRQEGGNHNYTFTESRDGREWSVNVHRPIVPNGAASKPRFDRFGGIYYLGWQEAKTINGVGRSIFNIEVSRDGREWERKYRFETERSFQYPVFYKHNDTIWLSVTQGDTSPSRKERIMFGKFE